MRLHVCLYFLGKCSAGILEEGGSYPQYFPQQCKEQCLLYGDAFLCTYVIIYLLQQSMAVQYCCVY